MRLFGRRLQKELSELDAVLLVNRTILQETTQMWPKFYQQLRGDGFWGQVVTQDEGPAGLDFTVAVMALEAQAVPNLFPADQATRIRDWILATISPGGPQGAEVGAFIEYEADCQSNSGANGNPIAAV